MGQRPAASNPVQETSIQFQRINGMSLKFTCPACSASIEARVSEDVTKCPNCSRSFRLQRVRKSQPEGGNPPAGKTKAKSPSGSFPPAIFPSKPAYAHLRPRSSSASGARPSSLVPHPPREGGPEAAAATTAAASSSHHHPHHRSSNSRVLAIIRNQNAALRNNNNNNGGGGMVADLPPIKPSSLSSSLVVGNAELVSNRESPRSVWEDPRTASLRLDKLIPPSKSRSFPTAGCHHTHSRNHSLDRQVYPELPAVPNFVVDDHQENSPIQQINSVLKRGWPSSTSIVSQESSKHNSVSPSNTISPTNATTTATVTTTTTTTTTTTAVSASTTTNPTVTSSLSSARRQIPKSPAPARPPPQVPSEFARRARSSSVPGSSASQSSSSISPVAQVTPPSASLALSLLRQIASFPPPQSTSTSSTSSSSCSSSASSSLLASRHNNNNVSVPTSSNSTITAATAASVAPTPSSMSTFAATSVQNNNPNVSSSSAVALALKSLVPEEVRLPSPPPVLSLAENSSSSIISVVSSSSTTTTAISPSTTTAAISPPSITSVTPSALSVAATVTSPVISPTSFISPSSATTEEAVVVEDEGEEEEVVLTAVPTSVPSIDPPPEVVIDTAVPDLPPIDNIPPESFLVSSVHAAPPPEDDFRPELYWHEVADSIIPLRKGELFTWVAEENGLVRLSEVFVYLIPGPPDDVKASTLHWCPPATRTIIPGQSLQLRDVTEMLQGCPPSLKPSSSRAAAKLIKNRCFTLFARKAAFPTLTMETEDKKMCVLWLNCLHRILINADRTLDGESRKKTVARVHTSQPRPASPITPSSTSQPDTSVSVPQQRDKSLSAPNCAQMSKLLEQQSQSSVIAEKPRNSATSFFSRLLQRGRRNSISSRSSSLTRSQNSRSNSPSHTASVAISLSSSRNSTMHESISPKHAKSSSKRRSSLPWRLDRENDRSPRGSSPTSTSAAAALLLSAKRTLLRRSSNSTSKQEPAKLKVLSGDELTFALERVRKGDGFVRYISKGSTKAVSVCVRGNKLMCRDADMQELVIALTDEVTITPGKKLFPEEPTQASTPSHLSVSTNSHSNESNACFSVTSPGTQLHLDGSSASKTELWVNTLHTILLRQHEVRAALRAIKRDPQFVKILEFMRGGSTMTQYHVPSQGPPLIQTVTMFYSDGNDPESMGSLFWVQLGMPREERARNCFPVECIVQMSLGKATRTLQAIATRADDRCCFTISPSKGKSLNLEAESCGKRALWVQGINGLLTAAKQVKKIPSKTEQPSKPLPPQAQVFTRFHSIEGKIHTETLRIWYRPSSSGRLGHLLWATVTPLTPIDGSDSTSHPTPGAEGSTPLAPSPTTGDAPVGSPSKEPAPKYMQMSLSSIKEIVLGRQTDGFGDVPVDPACCFTIFTGHHTLELCAQTPALREIWLTELHQLLTSSGVVAKKKPKNEVGRDRSMSVVPVPVVLHMDPQRPRSATLTPSSCPSSSTVSSSIAASSSSSSSSSIAASTSSKPPASFFLKKSLSNPSVPPTIATSSSSAHGSGSGSEGAVSTSARGSASLEVEPACTPSRSASPLRACQPACSRSSSGSSNSSGGSGGSSTSSGSGSSNSSAGGSVTSGSSSSFRSNSFRGTNRSGSFRGASSGSRVSPLLGGSKDFKRPPAVPALPLVSAPKALEEAELEKLSKGTLFDEYVLERQGTTITEALVCYRGPLGNAQIIWGPSKADPAEFTNKMSIASITHVALGKKSEAFLSRGGRKAKEDSCFSIHAGSVVLSLEADTNESRDHWLQSFGSLLVSSGSTCPPPLPSSGSGARASSSSKDGRFGVANEMPSVLLRPSNAGGLAFNQQDPSQIFTILAKIGQGSFGAVYRARDQRDNRIVGLKLMDCDADSTDEIQKEINILQNCSSEYIVALYGVYHKETSIWIAMEYCAAGSLADMMTVCRQTLTEAQIAVVMRMALLGLQYLHGRQILHRDIKAANLLMTESGHCKLADFGVSAEISALTHRAQTVIGTPNWMAPEVIRASFYNDRADIWSLGITAIELAVGKPPHSEVQAMTAMFRIPTAPAPTLPNRHLWSDNFNGFVKACLQKDHNQRPSAEVMLKHPFVANATDITPLKQFVDRCMLEMKSFRELNEASQGKSLRTNQEPASSTLRYS